MNQLLKKYVHYNLWANKRIIEILSKEADELINQTIKNSFPSLRLTIGHIWDAEIIWLRRLQGISLDSFPSKEFNGNSQELLEGWLDGSTEFLEFIKKQESSFLESTIHYATTKGDSFQTPAQVIIQHCMNHSTYHRGQIITICRQLDIPGTMSTDFITYQRTEAYKNDMS